MRNIISFKKNSAIFLATLLIIGTISTIVPSVQAEPYYGIDKDRKSDRKSVSVSSLKCNNINVNVNGLELDVFPQFLGGGEGLADEAQDANTDVNSFAGNGPNGESEINDFRFICINNNNNTVIEEEEPIPPIPPTPCELCFAELSPQAQENVNNFLATNGPIPIPQTIPPVSIPADVDTITELCAFLSAQQITVNAEELGLVELVSFFINLTDDPIAGPLLVTCLVQEARIFTIIT